MRSALTVGGGEHPDIQWRAGVWLVARQFGADLLITEHAPSGALIGGPRVYPLGGPAGVFARLHIHDGVAWVARRDGAPPYHGRAWAIGTLDPPIDYGPVHGAFPMALGDRWLAFQAGPAANGYPVYARRLGDREPSPDDSGHGRFVKLGAPTGLSRVADAGDFVQVATQDEDRQSVPGVVDPSWTLDGSLVVGATDRDGRPCVVARLQDGREAVLWPGQDSQNPRAAHDGAGTYAVTAWSGRGEGVRLQILDAALDFRHPDPGALMPLDQPVWMGAFYLTTDRYPEHITVAEYPHNCEVLHDEPAVAARVDRPVLIGRSVLEHGTINPDLVIGLYVALEKDADTVEAEVREVRRLWRARYPSRAQLPVIVYVTPPMVEDGFAPKRCSADLWSPEFYFPAGLPPSAAGVRAKRLWWIEKGFSDRPWLPACQAYDRNVVVGADYIRALADTTGAFVDLCRATHVKGLLWFAVNRALADLSIGGVAAHRALLEAHRRAYAAIPAGLPPALPLRPIPPDPRPDPVEPPKDDPMPDFSQLAPPPRNEILNTLTWLRDEVYPGLLGETLNDEGIAAWLVDAYAVVGRLKKGLSHEDAKHYVFREIQKAKNPGDPTFQ